MDLLPALPTADALEAAADPATFVIASCERAKSWLAHCLEGNHIEAIAETKAQAEAIRVYTMQKQLGKDAELSACEIVQRAERCIELAVRHMQKTGLVAKRGDIGKHGGADGGPRGAHLKTPKQIVGRKLRYVLADGVSDEQFDAAIEGAKAEGNLSRANVVRRIKGGPSAKRIWDRLAALIAEGHTSDQIAAELGVHRSTVVEKAKKLGIKIQADDVVRGTRRLNHERMLREFVATLESLAPSCDLIDASKIDAGTLAECVEVMDEAMRTLSKFLRRMRKEGKA